VNQIIRWIVIVLTYTVAAVVLFAAASTLYGQCPGGVCPINQGQQQQRAYGQCPGGVCPINQGQQQQRAYGQCPGGVCPVNQPQQQIRALAQPSPAVVQINSTLGDSTLHGTGSIVSIRNGTATILTCAHIFKAKCAPSVRYADGLSSPAKIISIDAANDTAILQARSSPVAKYMEFDESPQVGSIVSWCGYPSSGYTSGAGRVLGYRGDDLVFEGNVPEGTSGGPVYTSRGIVAVLSECDKPNDGSRGWRTYGPCSQILRRLLPPYRRPTTTVIVQQQQQPKDIAVLPIPDPCEPAAGENTTMPTAPETSGLDARLERIEAMLDALAKKPSPPGPAGPQGPPGKDGKAGAVGPNGSPGMTVGFSVGSLSEDQIAALAARLPPIHVQVIKDGEILETEDVFLGGTLPLRLVPVVQPGGN